MSFNAIRENKNLAKISRFTISVQSISIIFIFCFVSIGRLHVSSIDGKVLLTNKYTHLETFGGRGFSVWDASDLKSPFFDSAGSIEQYMETFDKSVFNTDCLGSSAAAYQSPEILRDTQSDNMVIACTLFIRIRCYASMLIPSIQQFRNNA